MDPLQMEATRGADEPDGPFAGPADLIGRYVVLRELGAGAMGVVYAAYDPDLERKVAIKVLRAELGGGPEGAVRMRREAQAMARLSHPNVAQIYEVGEHAGRLFLAMEYIDGVTVRTWLERQVRTVPAIVAVYAEAGRGLAAAHAAGLTHRDFKPDNVLVRADGRVCVLDFGLSRAQATGRGPALVADDDDDDADAQVSRDGALIGTPAYMSPEQLLHREADARSDQFSFFSSLHLSQTPTARKQGQMREIAGFNSPVNWCANPQVAPGGLRGFGENQETGPGGASRGLTCLIAPPGM